MSEKDQEYWIGLASDAYDQSTTFLDNNYRKKWDDCLSHFQSKHAPGSKYYKGRTNTGARSSGPRPVQCPQHRSGSSRCFFSNVQVVNIEAQDQGSQVQRISAAHYAGTAAVPPDQDHPVVSDLAGWHAGRSGKRRGLQLPVLGIRDRVAQGW